MIHAALQPFGHGADAVESTDLANVEGVRTNRRLDATFRFLIS